MKKVNILFCILFILFQNINAQPNFLSGYIISKTNDTIHGLIDKRGDLFMGSVCRFKLSEKDVVDVYSPTDIRGFRFTDSKYFISEEIITPEGKKRVFLEFLIQGKLNVFYYRDSIRDHFYIEKEGNEIEELPYKESIIKNRGYTYLKSSKSHIGILNYYMSDVPDFQSRIKRIKRPEQYNLIRLAEDYHHSVCKDEECIIYGKKLPLVKISIEPAVGQVYYFYSKKYSYDFGVYILSWAPRTNEKLYARLGFFTHSYYENSKNNVTAFRFPLQIQYTAPCKILQPRINFGINFYTLKLTSQDYYTKDEIKYVGHYHTVNIGGGLLLNISNEFRLSLNANSEYTPIMFAISDKDVKFKIISLSYNLGLNITF